MQIPTSARSAWSLNGLAAEQRMEIYADTVAELASGPAEADVVLSKVEGDGEAGDAAMRVTEQAGVDTELDIEGAADTGGRPTTSTGDAHLRTIQLLDRDDIRELVHEGIGVIVHAAARPMTYSTAG